MPQQSRPDLVELAISSKQIGWNDKALKLMRGSPDLRGFTDLGVKQLLIEFVCKQCGKCKARPETDPDWLDRNADDPWWYCVVIPVPEFAKGLFVKVRLLWEDGDLESDAYVEIIGVHEEK